MQKKPLDVTFLTVGLLVVASTIAIAQYMPDAHAKSEHTIRLLASLGGGFIGATLPGLLNVEVKGIRAAGALALVVMFYLYTPEPSRAEATQPPGKAGDQQPTPAVAFSAGTIDKSPVVIGPSATVKVDYGPAGKD